MLIDASGGPSSVEVHPERPGQWPVPPSDTPGFDGLIDEVTWWGLGFPSPVAALDALDELAAAVQQLHTWIHHDVRARGALSWDEPQ